MEFSPSIRYSVTEKIGEGGTANVYLAKDLQKDTTVALKVLNDTSINFTKFFDKELSLLTKIHHPNILEILDSGSYEFDFLKNQKRQYITLEYCEKGELFNYIYYPQKGFSETFGRAVFKSIVQGVQVCHMNGIAHRDLKMENILLDKDFNIKIADFGFAALIEGKNKDGLLYTPVGTDRYRAPELIKRIPYNGEKADIFSLGALLFTLITCNFGFSSASLNDKCYKYIIRNNIRKYWNIIGRSVKLTKELSDEFKDLYIKMISFEPNERPSIDEILGHPWLTKEKMPNEDELIEEFKKREVIVNESLELEKNVKESKDSSIVYRNEGDIEVYFYEKMQYGMFKGKKGDRKRNAVVLKGEIVPYRVMNEIVNEFKQRMNDRNLVIQIITSENKLKFKVVYESKIFDWNEGEEEEDANENEELIEMQNLVFEVKMKMIKENEEYIILFNKKNGDYIQYCEIVDEFKQIIRDIL